MKTKFLFIFFIGIFQLTFQSQASAASTALVFNGQGSSYYDVVALENILISLGITYDKASSAQINAMTELKLRSYKLIVWPGGNSIDMGNSLTTTATALVRRVVTKYGVSYLGFCAGAFMAERSTLYNVFNLANTWFDFYQQNMQDIVQIYFPDGTQRNMVYWDGPALNGFGYVIGKYPNGQSAIAESFVGSGLVILTGVHPEAPANWLPDLTSSEIDSLSGNIAFTKTLIRAALARTLLPHF